MNTNPMKSEAADHKPYIETVRAALLVKDVHVGAVAFSTGRVRGATMPLFAPDDDTDDPWHYTFIHAERVELRWSEEDGWSLLALHTRGDALLPTIWRRGFGIVLPPEDVGAWLSLLLTMPGFSSSQEDGPYRSHQQHDAALEATLAAYAI